MIQVTNQNDHNAKYASLVKETQSYTQDNSEEKGIGELTKIVNSAKVSAITDVVINEGPLDIEELYMDLERFHTGLFFTEDEVQAFVSYHERLFPRGVVKYFYAWKILVNNK